MSDGAWDEQNILDERDDRITIAVGKGEITYSSESAQSRVERDANDRRGETGGCWSAGERGGA